jgi:hypothetical protein
MSAVVLYREVKGYGFHYVRFDSRQETYVVGFVMCGCFDNCVGVLVICVLVFTVLLHCFVYVYLFLFVTSLSTATY